METAVGGMEWLIESSQLGLDAGQAQTMRLEWLEVFGPLRCAHCGGEIVVGEQFTLSGRCTYGGMVPLGEGAQAYADTLDAYAEHVDCR